jgi:hypothetical protein
MGDFTVNVRQKPMDFNRWQLGLKISSLIGRSKDIDEDDQSSIIAFPNNGL